MTEQLNKKSRENLAESFLKNELLYGKNPEEQIVRVHQISDTQVRVYKRSGGTVSHTDEPFFPFFFIANNGFKHQAENEQQRRRCL